MLFLRHDGGAPFDGYLEDTFKTFNKEVEQEAIGKSMMIDGVLHSKFVHNATKGGNYTAWVMRKDKYDDYDKQALRNRVQDDPDYYGLKQLNFDQTIEIRVRPKTVDASSTCLAGTAGCCVHESLLCAPAKSEARAGGTIEFVVVGMDAFGNSVAGAGEGIVAVVLSNATTTAPGIEAYVPDGWAESGDSWLDNRPVAASTTVPAVSPEDANFTSTTNSTAESTETNSDGVATFETTMARRRRRALNEINGTAAGNGTDDELADDDLALADGDGGGHETKQNDTWHANRTEDVEMNATSAIVPNATFVTTSAFGSSASSVASDIPSNGTVPFTRVHFLALTTSNVGEFHKVELNMSHACDGMTCWLGNRHMGTYRVLLFAMNDTSELLALAEEVTQVRERSPMQQVAAIREDNAVLSRETETKNEKQTSFYGLTSSGSVNSTVYEVVLETGTGDAGANATYPEKLESRDTGISLRFFEFFSARKDSLITSFPIRVLASRIISPRLSFMAKSDRPEPIAPIQSDGRGRSMRGFIADGLLELSPYSLRVWGQANASMLIVIVDGYGNLITPDSEDPQLPVSKAPVRSSGLGDIFRVAMFECESPEDRLCVESSREEPLASWLNAKSAVTYDEFLSRSWKARTYSINYGAPRNGTFAIVLTLVDVYAQPTAAGDAGVAMPIDQTDVLPLYFRVSERVCDWTMGMQADIETGSKCICSPGYRADINGVCEPCGGDKSEFGRRGFSTSYNPFSGQNECVPCPTMYDDDPKRSSFEATVDPSDPSRLVASATSFDSCVCLGQLMTDDGKAVKEHGYVRIPHLWPVDAGGELTIREGRGEEYTAKMNETRGRGTCLRCPRGAICRQGNNTLEHLASEPGFWRQNSRSARFVDCSILSKGKTVRKHNSPCLSAAIGFGERPCTDGHRGVICSSCEEGWVRQPWGASCNVCKSDTKSRAFRWLLISVIVCGLTLLLTTVVRVWIRSEREKIEKNQTTMRSST